MIREKEATGATVEEALNAGCTELGVSPDDLNVRYEVVDFPVKKGFFRPAVPARVKVTVELPDPEPVAAPKTEAEAEAVPVPEELIPPQRPIPAARPDPQETAEPAVLVREKKKPSAPAPAPAVSAAAPAEEQTDAVPAAFEEKDGSQSGETPVDIESNVKVKAAVDYLREVMEKMGVPGVSFTAVEKGGAVILRASGKNVGALIGRRGETMESLSYLASLVANMQEGDYIKLGLDVGGYRDKREQDLAALARRIGARVRRSGRAFAMEPMNPYERRIIHSAITGMEDVRSESAGEGRDRHVVIYSTAANARNDNPETERRSRRDGDRGDRGSRRGGGSGSGSGRRQGGPRGGSDEGRRGRRDGRRSDRGDRRGPRPSGVPEREYSSRDASDATPVAPKRTERVDDFADIGFGRIEL